MANYKTFSNTYTANLGITGEREGGRGGGGKFVYSTLFKGLAARVVNQVVKMHHRFTCS